LLLNETNEVYFALQNRNQSKMTRLFHPNLHRPCLRSAALPIQQEWLQIGPNVFQRVTCTTSACKVYTFLGQTGRCFIGV